MVARRSLGGGSVASTHSLNSRHTRSSNSVADSVHSVSTGRFSQGGVSQGGMSIGVSVGTTHSHGSRVSQGGLSQGGVSQGGVSQSRVTLPTFVTHLGVNHDCPKCDKVRHCPVD